MVYSCAVPIKYDIYELHIHTHSMSYSKGGARTGRIISTADASANGTARGFATLSLTHISWSSSLVKKSCLSFSINQASKLSIVWNDDSEISYLVSTCTPVTECLQLPGIRVSLTLHSRPLVHLE